MKIKFPPMPDFLYIQHGSFMSQWCCKCGNRHIWHFYIVRGNEREEDMVELTGFQDNIGTKLRKCYEKEQKEHTK